MTISALEKKQKASKKDIELLKMEIEEKCADRISLMNIVGLINFKTFKPKKLSYVEKGFFEFVCPRNFYNKQNKNEFKKILSNNQITTLTLIGENKRKYSIFIKLSL